MTGHRPQCPQPCSSSYRRTSGWNYSLHNAPPGSRHLTDLHWSQRHLLPRPDCQDLQEVSTLPVWTLPLPPPGHSPSGRPPHSCSNSLLQYKLVAAFASTQGLSLLQYLEDWNISARPAHSCLAWNAWLSQLVEHLGFTVNFSKSSLTPSCSFYLLGITFDLTNSTARPAQYRV